MRVAICIALLTCGMASAEPALTSETWKFTESKVKATYSLVRKAGQYVFASPDGRHVVFVENQGNYEIRSGSKITKRARKAIDVRFSPKNDYVAFVEQAKTLAIGTDLTVIRLADHAVVYSAEGGADPIWIPKTLAFRIRNQALRLDLPTVTPKKVGPPQTTFGCPNADAPFYGGQEALETCPSKRFSSVRGVDPTFSKWLVVDRDDTQDVAVRVVDIASTKDTVVADSALGSPLYTSVSPNGTRYCVRPRTNREYAVSCGRFPDTAVPQQVAAPEDRLPEMAWLDEDRFLLEGLGGMIDLAKNTAITFSRATRFSRLFPMGRRYVLADEFLLDLDKRVYIDAREDKKIHEARSPHSAVAGADRMWITRYRRDAFTYDAFELKLSGR